jgi:hypothetical protein
MRRKQKNIWRVLFIRLYSYCQNNTKEDRVCTQRWSVGFSVNSVGFYLGIVGRVAQIRNRVRCV